MLKKTTIKKFLSKKLLNLGKKHFKLKLAAFRAQSFIYRIKNVHNSKDQRQKKWPFEIFGDKNFHKFGKSTNQWSFAYSPIFIQSQMVTIQQINSLKNPLWKIIQVINCTILTAVCRILHSIDRGLCKCSQISVLVKKIKKVSF